MASTEIKICKDEVLTYGKKFGISAEVPMLFQKKFDIRGNNLYLESCSSTEIYESNLIFEWIILSEELKVCLH